MGLSLLLHRPLGADAKAEGEALRDAVWEVADAHWAVSDEAVLVSSDLSPEYMIDHFRRALARRGHRISGMLIVTAVGPRAAWVGLPPEADAWLREGLA